VGEREHAAQRRFRLRTVTEKTAVFDVLDRQTKFTVSDRVVRAFLSLIKRRRGCAPAAP
jgi:hypothetical protein